MHLKDDKSKGKTIREMINILSAIIGTLERDFVLALTEMLEGQLANIQMKKQRSPHLIEKS